MKKLTIVLAILLSSYFSYPVFGQTSTIFSGGNIGYTGFYAGPSLFIHHIDGVGRTSVGGEIGVGFSNFLFGGYLNTTIREFDTDLGESDISVAHGGLVLGFTTNQRKAIHFISKLKIGIGDSDVGGADFFGVEDMDDILAITPEVGIELNLFPFAKMGIIASYQHVIDMDNVPGFESSDFSGFGGGISFRLGMFNRDFEEDEELEIKRRRRN